MPKSLRAGPRSSTSQRALERFARDGAAAPPRAAGASSRARRAGVPATSSITGCTPPPFAARYSVWPWNGMPGVVDRGFLHRRGDHGVEAAGQAALGRGVEQREHVAGVRGVRAPGDDLAGEACAASTGSVPARCGAGGASALPVGGRERKAERPARAASRSGSPAKTSSAGQSMSAAASASSGPMPAGSPVVTIEASRVQGFLIST